MATDTARYVNAPGSVIVHLADGTSEQLHYGDPVPENLADYVDPSTFSDTTPRRPEVNEALEAEAHRRAALAENGQVNSSSSAVPGNYSELDEDGAATLIGNLDRYPEAQAQILIHEILYGGGRQKVIDAATPAARLSASTQIDALPPSVTELGTPDRTPVASGNGDPYVASADEIADRAVKAAGNRATPGPSGDAEEGYRGQNVEDLQAEADRRGLQVEGTGSSGNVIKKDLVTALEADDANNGSSDDSGD